MSKRNEPLWLSIVIVLTAYVILVAGILSILALILSR